MAEALTVSIAALRRALDLVLDEVARKHGETVVLDADHYRVLPPEMTYDVHTSPAVDRMTIAQLSDDVAELAGMVEDDEWVSEPWHDLAHLVGILQRIAAQDLPAGGDRLTSEGVR